MTTSKKFSFPKTVTKNDLDQLNHVNNVRYVQWVQEAAEKHWQDISNTSMNEGCIWVVLRHEIDYFSEAIESDELIITTYIGDTYGVKSERIVEIYKNKVLLVKAKTIWCLLATETKRPMRISNTILDLLDKNKITAN